MNYSMNRLLVVILGTTLAVSILTACSQRYAEKISSGTPLTQEPLRVAIAPYQDMAMLTGEKELGLEKKYGTKLEFLTMPWEDMIPAVASAGQTVDVGFGSLADYMCKSERLNSQGDDRLLYLYPAYVFRGGGFATFNAAVPELNSQTIKNPNLVKKFLSFKFAAQKFSTCHMLLYVIAHNAGVKFSDVQVTDTPLNDGFLAAENGSVDAAAVGLTQRTEALKRHGRIAVDMDTVGLVDIAGFICKESVYKKRKKDIDALIRIWCDATNYVVSDVDHHNTATLAYLKANSSTKYTIDELRRALSQEYFPKSIVDAEQTIISDSGKYSFARMSKWCSQYLADIGATKTSRTAPKLIRVSE